MAIRQQVESERKQVAEKDTLPDFFFFYSQGLFMCTGAHLSMHHVSAVPIDAKRGHPSFETGVRGSRELSHGC